MSVPEVVRAASLGWQPLRNLLEPFGLQIQSVPAEQAIPGSHWGDDVMEPERRLKLHTDAGGSSAEENAVCYLQILMAERLVGYSSARMLLDMDRWGYSFRLGSAKRWFEEDAEDARLALIERLPHLGSSDWIRKSPVVAIGPRICTET